MSDVQVDAPKEFMLDTDPVWFVNVDPANVDIVVRGGRVEVTRADAKGKMFSIRTPLLEASWPKVTAEGNLGETINAKGKKQTKRDEAKFELTLQRSLANMDDELRDIDDTLSEQQALFYAKMYQIARNILGKVYDTKAGEYRTEIADAETKVRADRIIFEKGKGSGFTTPDKLKAAMASDPALKADVESQYRDAFIDGATYMLANPDDYDETGCRVVEAEDGTSKTHHMQLKCKRKVFKLVKGKTADTAAALPSFSGVKTTPAGWPALIDSLVDHEYNPFAWWDPQGNEASEHKPFLIDRPTYKPGGTGEKIVDPFWNPFQNMTSLVSTTLLFSVVKVMGNYGVVAKPFKKVFIWRQKERPARNETAGYNRRLAGGFVKRERTTDNVYGDDESAADAKRPKVDAAAAAATTEAQDDEDEEEMRAAMD